MRKAPMLHILAAITTVGAFGAPVMVASSGISGERSPNHNLADIAQPVSRTAEAQNRQKPRDSRIASAVAPLDLRVLTLADFGDVDVSR